MLHSRRRQWHAAAVPSMREQARRWLRRNDGGCRCKPKLLQSLLDCGGVGIRASRLRLLRDAWQCVHPKERGRVPVSRLR